jgi:hypothetical protein
MIKMRTPQLDILGGGNSNGDSSGTSTTAAAAGGANTQAATTLAAAATTSSTSTTAAATTTSSFSSSTKTSTTATAQTTSSSSSTSTSATSTLSSSSSSSATPNPLHLSHPPRPVLLLPPFSSSFPSFLRILETSSLTLTLSLYSLSLDKNQPCTPPLSFLSPSLSLRKSLLPALALTLSRLATSATVFLQLRMFRRTNWQLSIQTSTQDATT